MQTWQRLRCSLSRGKGAQYSNGRRGPPITDYDHSSFRPPISFSSLFSFDRCAGRQGEALKGGGRTDDSGRGCGRARGKNELLDQSISQSIHAHPRTDRQIEDRRKRSAPQLWTNLLEILSHLPHPSETATGKGGVAGAVPTTWV